MLSTQGLSDRALARLQLDAAGIGQALGAFLRHELGDIADDTRRADLARVAVQLSATAFEIGFLTAATDGADDGPPPGSPTAGQAT
jgi:hypothetical protein